MYREQEIKSTRKKHRCVYCTSDIPKGESAVYHAGLNTEGDFVFCHVHPVCNEILGLIDVRDGWHFGQFYDDCDAYFNGETEGKTPADLLEKIKERKKQ